MCPIFPPEGAGLEESNHNEMTARRLAPAGKRIVDVGCGEGALSRFLAGEGAQVVGLDPAADKIEAAARAATAEGSAADFRVGGGESLPFEDGSLDVVLYSNSLHHVSLDAMRPALQEAARVLKPGGLLYVMEPLARGPFFEIQRLWNDETEVRARAYDQVAAAADLGFEPVDEAFYGAARRYAGYDDFAAKVGSQNPTNAAAFREMGEALQASFDAHARRDGGEYVLDMSFRVNILKRLG
jgi:ubiquinone/menaquinone biosynthesis C-methylase UbiE